MCVFVWFVVDDLKEDLAKYRASRSATQGGCYLSKRLQPVRIGFCTAFSVCVVNATVYFIRCLFVIFDKKNLQVA